MGDYSISYLDVVGGAIVTDLFSFDDDQAAIAFARLGLERYPIVEVLKNNSLLVRLYEEEASVEPATKKKPALATP
jgi:hypothetical protein